MALGFRIRYYEPGKGRDSRPDLAPPGTISAGAVSTVLASLAALLALLLPFLVALGLPLRLARLAFLLVLLEGAARPTIPVAFAAATAAISVAIPAATAALTAVPATFAAAPLSSLAHGRSFR